MRNVFFRTRTNLDGGLTLMRPKIKAVLYPHPKELNSNDPSARIVSGQVLLQSSPRFVQGEEIVEHVQSPFFFVSGEVTDRRAIATRQRLS